MGNLCMLSAAEGERGVSVGGCRVALAPWVVPVHPAWALGSRPQSLPGGLLSGEGGAGPEPVLAAPLGSAILRTLPGHLLTPLCPAPLHSRGGGQTWTHILLLTPHCDLAE